MFKHQIFQIKLLSFCPVLKCFNLEAVHSLFSGNPGSSLKWSNKKFSSSPPLLQNLAVLHACRRPKSKVSQKLFTFPFECFDILSCLKHWQQKMNNSWKKINGTKWCLLEGPAFFHQLIHGLGTCDRTIQTTTTFNKCYYLWAFHFLHGQNKWMSDEQLI